MGTRSFVPSSRCHLLVATFLVGVASTQAQNAYFDPSLGVGDAIIRSDVFVGDKQATLAVTRSDELAQDVAGEVVAVDGTVLYRAELLDVRKGEGPNEASARLEK